MPNDVVNLQSALDSISDPWQPHRLVSVNDSDVKVAKLRGEFIWHSHPDSDELFLVVSGSLTLQLRDRDIVLAPSDVFVVPRGAEHCPLAREEVSVVMIELKGTVNTGDAGGERTVEVRELSRDD
jgi:mannose-6-phosphate isomerase-like protein (cupin superfamily)